MVSWHHQNLHRRIGQYKSLMNLYVDLVYLEESLEIRVVTLVLLKMKVIELQDLEEDNNLNMVMVEAPKLLEILVTEDIVKLEFQQSGSPKLFERIRYAEIQEIPSLYKCEEALDLEPGPDTIL